jgi:class 3 adenylate cyclase/tetratricopeptide (TPR) repeat protein
VAAELAFCTSCGARVLGADDDSADERKRVTVFFADMVGFTGRAERLDPEEVRALLRPFHRRLRHELERFGGTVEKFIGDAVMAVFGAPAAHEDDPERAVRAAFAVRRAVAGLNARDPSLDLHVRIGVNTGEAVVTPGALAAAGESVVSGDVVNTAARLQTAAPVDGILVGDATRRATHRRISYRRVDPVHAKGKSTPVVAWEAVEPRGRYGLEVAQPGPAPLVGRERELAGLREALDRVRERRSPEIVSIVGAPGIGKSRLVFELFQAADASSRFQIWRQGRCLPYGGGPLGALAEIVRAHAGIVATDDADVRRDAVHAAVHDLLGDGAEAAWVEGHLRALAGAEGELPLPGDHRAEAFAAWRTFFEALAARHPAVLVFEDLHWADPPLLDFLASLLEWSTESPLLLLATARPEFLERHRGWPAAARSTAMRLPPLSDEQTATLVRALLDGARVPAGLEAALLGGAGGNALYAEEYVRMLRDRDVLRREDGTWRIAPGAELPAPESVQSIIAARIDALPADEKSVIQDAAVVGKVFTIGAVKAIGDRSRWTVAEALNRLAQKELIRREPHSAVAGEAAYAFRHALVPTVAYSQIPHARRAGKHRRAAEWIESIVADHVDQLADALAHHHRQAVDYTRAAGGRIEGLAAQAHEALRAAGDRAATLNAFAAAATLYGSALELADEERRPALLLARARARFRVDGGDPDELERARAALAGEPEAAAEAAVMLGELLWTRGRRDEAFARFADARALVDGRPPSRSTVHVLANVSRFLTMADAHEDAVALGRRALADAGRLGLDDLCAHALTTIGAARVASGDAGGVGDLERSVEIARAIGSAETVRASMNLASTMANLGDLAGAFGVYADGRAEATRFGDTARLRWFEAEQLYEWYWTGAWDEALGRADAFVGEFDGGDRTIAGFDGRLVRARIALARGDVAPALADAQSMVEFADEARAGQLLHPALALLARALADAGRRDDAAAAVERLIAAWRDGGRPLVTFWASDLAMAAERIDGAGSLASLAGGGPPAVRWLEAAEAYACREFAVAAARYAAIGARPEAALSTVRADAAGERTDRVTLAEARAFLAGVRASEPTERAVAD